MAIIYKITNILNGKSYIGATVYTLKNRMNRHRSDAKNRRTKQTIHNAINKYGWENFKVEQIFEHPDADYVFNVMEAKLIKEHRTHGTEGGYNMTWGGDGHLGMKLSDETKKKIGDANRGKKRTEEEKKAQSLRQMGRKPWNDGIKCPSISEGKSGVRSSQKTKEILSKAKLGIKHSDGMKAIMAEKMSERHVISEPNNPIQIEVTNLRQYCIEKGLSQGNLVTYGQSKGYKLHKTFKKHRVYTIKNVQTGEVLVIDKLNQFCKIHNISTSGIISAYRKNRPYMFYQIINLEITETVKNY